MASYESERKAAQPSPLGDDDHRTFRLKLGAIAIGLLLVNLAVGLFAHEQQRTTIDYAINIYDTAFTSTNYIHHAQISFQHFSDDRLRAVGPAAIALANETLTKAIDQLDVAIERSSSLQARTQAVAAKAKLASLATVDMDGAELAAHLGTIEDELERLGQRAANIVLRARDDVEEFASKNDLLSLASTFTSIMLAGLALIVLHRMVNSANRSRAQFAETLQANARERRRLEAQEKEAAARVRKAELKKLADDFQTAVGHVVDSVMSTATGLEAAAITLTQTAETTEQLSSAVAQASERASTNVHSVAASTEEMALSFGEIGRRVQESHKIASEAVRQAQQTDARIHELSTAASRIGNVVRLITSVAEQTNLLALNATIEAARAGEAGRGFAVVAQEVKALASQTAKAIDEIHAQITGIQSATEDTVTSIRVIGATIGQLSEISMVVAAAMVEQDATTRGISHNVSEAAKDTAQVATNITDVNRGANETRSASAQLLSSAQLLTNESNRLKAEVAKLLDTVRAA